MPKGQLTRKQVSQKIKLMVVLRTAKTDYIKAEWEGIPVQFVDPKLTSQLCPIYGVKLQEDWFHRRKLLCINCKKSMDRDVVASMNIACKGWSRFCHPGGLLVEAVKGNVDWNNGPMKPLVL